MRIVHIGTKGLPSQGGTERVVEAVALRHAESHDVTVYGNSRTCTTGIFGGVRVIAVATPGNKYLGPVWLDVASSLRVLFSGKADVVHVHGSENAFVLPLLRIRFPVVTTNHGPAYERAKWGRIAKAMIHTAEKGSVVHADAATAVSLSQAHALSQRYGVEVAHIPNGIDPNEPADADGARRVLSELGLEQGGFAMFAAARVDPTKGCLTLLEAWRVLECPIPLLVVGDLWHAEGHEEQLREAARGMDVHFLPRIADKALLLGLVRLSDVFVFPSTVEAMSMMLLEAAALGVPVLASSIPENVDILPDSEGLFLPGDAEDLARAYRALKSESASAIRAWCQHRSSFMRSHYDWGRIADEYEAVYERAVQARNTQSGKELDSGTTGHPCKSEQV